MAVIASVAPQFMGNDGPPNQAEKDSGGKVAFMLSRIGGGGR